MLAYHALFVLERTRKPTSYGGYMTSFARRSVSTAPRWILLFATAVMMAGLLQLLHLRPVFAANGGYPWYNATYVDANYDWGYNPCPSSDPNCMKMTDKGYGTADPWR